MNQEELWKYYVSKNPSFAGDGNVTMSAAGLRKLFSQTYTIAHEQGISNGKAWAEMKEDQRKKGDLFGSIFK